MKKRIKAINIIKAIKDIVMSQSQRKLIMTTDIWKCLEYMKKVKQETSNYYLIQFLDAKINSFTEDKVHKIFSE